MYLLRLFSVGSSRLRCWFLVGLWCLFHKLACAQKDSLQLLRLPRMVGSKSTPARAWFSWQPGKDKCFLLFDFNLRSVLRQFTQACPNFRQTFNSYCILVPRPLGGCCWLYLLISMFFIFLLWISSARFRLAPQTTKGFTICFSTSSTSWLPPCGPCGLWPVRKSNQCQTSSTFWVLASFGCLHWIYWHISCAVQANKANTSRPPYQHTSNEHVWSISMGKQIFHTIQVMHNNLCLFQKPTGLPWQSFNLWWMGAFNAIWDIAAGSKEASLPESGMINENASWAPPVNHLWHELPSQQMVHHHHW